jgi:hypothetical protein
MSIIIDTVLRGPKNERERVLATTEMSGGVSSLALFHVTAPAGAPLTHWIPLAGRHPQTVLDDWLKANLAGYVVI